MSGQWGNQMCIYCRFHQGPAMCYLEVQPGLPGSRRKLFLRLKQVPGLNKAHGPKKQFIQHFLHSCKNWNRNPTSPLYLVSRNLPLGQGLFWL